MVLNPPLILVSALFFLTLTSFLYLAAWLLCAAVLRRGGEGISPLRAKRLLMTALTLPPVLAALSTIGGATLHHVHLPAAREHHNIACGTLYTYAFHLEWFRSGAVGRDVVGVFINGASWLLVGVGICLLAKLVHATVRLERGLSPYQSPPSPRLQESLTRVGTQLPGLRPERFFECPIPAGYSSVLGFRRARCVLSQGFVASAPEDELDAVVAHEACHIRAGDVLGTFCVGLLNCFFFYIRPVRLLARRWRETAELACDDMAVAATAKPLAMASAILRASGVPVNGSRLPAVALPFADEAACPPSRRVERLMTRARGASRIETPESRMETFSGWFATLALAGLGGFILLSSQAACYAHCSLEVIARLLP